jgi:hypothetical protein
VPSRTRSRLLRIAAAVAALAAAAGVLMLAGAFDDDEEPVDPAPIAVAAPKPKEPPLPDVATFDVGGHPGAIAIGQTVAFIADVSSPELSAIATGGGPEDVVTTKLPHPAISIGESGTDLWLGYPEERAVEYRSIESDAAAEPIELDAVAGAIAADESGAWVLTESAVQRVEPGARDAVESFGAGGFATAMAVDGDDIWVVADNREVRRFDAASLEAADEIAEVPDATAIAVGEGYAWVLAATGELTRLDTQSLRAVGESVRVPGALALAVGEGAAWVTSADGAVTRVDPGSGEVVGSPVKAGDDPVAVSAGAGAIWVANAGDGTVTRIAP